MKTFKKQMTFICAVLSLLSCGKDRTVVPAWDGNDGRAIAFRLAGHGSRLSVTDAGVLVRDGFAVSGVAAGHARFADRVATWDASSQLFRTQATFYLPYEDTMSFWAVYPTDMHLQGLPDAPQLSFRQFPGGGQGDAVVAGAQAVGNDDPTVPLEFRHIFAGLSLSARGADTLVTYVLRSVTLTAPAEASYRLDTDVWTPADRDTSMTIALGGGAAIQDGGTLRLDDVQGVSVLPGAVRLTVEWDCLQDGVLVGRYVNSTPVLELGQGHLSEVTIVMGNTLAVPFKFEVSIQAWQGSEKEIDLGEGAERRPSSLQ